jgi:hypothetical protein
MGQAGGGWNSGLHWAFAATFLAKMVHRRCAQTAATHLKESKMRPTQTIFCTMAASAVVGLLAGCADLNDLGLAALSYKVPAYAIVDEQLVQGELVLFPNHTGTVTLRAEVAPVEAQAAVAGGMPKPTLKPAITSCVGRLRYTETTAGVIDLRCNDGATADLKMSLIGETRGYGYGYTANGLASVVFGFTPVEARAHLTVPPGKQLLERAEGGGLELK